LTIINLLPQHYTHIKFQLVLLSLLMQSFGVSLIFLEKTYAHYLIPH
jgi:hypothetical protein